MVKNVFLSLCIIMTMGYLSLHNSANAQTPTPTSVPTPTSKGSLSGTVTDESGDPVSGADVMLKSKKLQFKDSGTTGTNGEYEFSDLDAGKYVLKVKKSGYKKATKNVKLKQGEDKVVDVQLKTKGSGGGSGSGSGSGSGGGSGSGSGSGSGKK